MTHPQDPQPWVLPVLTEQIDDSESTQRTQGQAWQGASLRRFLPPPSPLDAIPAQPWPPHVPTGPQSWTDLDARIDELVEHQVRECIRPALMQAMEALVEECSVQISRELAQSLKSDLRAHLPASPAPVVLGEDAVLVEDLEVSPEREGSATAGR